MQKGVKSNAVTTNFDGNFTIKVAPGTPLRISYVGYKPEEMAASNGMTVYLQPTTEQLDQLVVVGYGTQKKANLTGAVATVDVARVMDSRPVQDVTRALQGAIPGLTITTNNGDFSAAPPLKSVAQARCRTALHLRHSSLWTACPSTTCPTSTPRTSPTSACSKTQHPPPSTAHAPRSA